MVELKLQVIIFLIYCIGDDSHLFLAQIEMHRFLVFNSYICRFNWVLSPENNVTLFKQKLEIKRKPLFLFTWIHTHFFFQEDIINFSSAQPKSGFARDA